MSRTTACICDDIFLLERLEQQQSLDQKLVPLTVLVDGPDAEATEGEGTLGYLE
jgi:hypothetical protein